MSATATRQSINEVLDALQAALEALQWNGGPALDRVEQYDLRDLAEGLRALLLYPQRIALIVAGEETFEPRLQARTLFFTRTLRVTLIVADRVLGDREAAVRGNTVTPGARGLYELMLGAVTGQLLDNPGGVVCRPVRARMDLLKDPAQPQLGRAVLELEVACIGGTLEARLNDGPTL